MRKLLAFVPVLLLVFTVSVVARGEAPDNVAAGARPTVVVEVDNPDEARSIVSGLKFRQPRPKIVVRRIDRPESRSLSDSSPEGKMLAQMIRPRVRSEYMTDSGAVSTEQTRAAAEGQEGKFVELAIWEDYYGIKPQDQETYLTRLVNVYWAQATRETKLIDVSAE